MVSVRSRGESARTFLLENVEAHPKDIARFAVEGLKLTRPAVLRHLNLLAKEGALIITGLRQERRYALAPQVQWEKTYNIATGPAEDVAWRQDVAPLLGPLPTNVIDIWDYVFTEMFNNAREHSSGTQIVVQVHKTAASTSIRIWDDGVGIFRKIQETLGLLDERHAVLELAKGKLTTAPSEHSGEGIFFSSRMLDEFNILSGTTFFSHEYKSQEDFILERSRVSRGTAVHMRLNNHTARTTRSVFSDYAGEESLVFSRTVVPVHLAQYGDDKLVSRSQARRLLDRVDRFKIVVLDFAGVETIGQAFSDEIFRVFPLRHPEVTLHVINAEADVAMMIGRAKATVVRAP